MLGSHGLPSGSTRSLSLRYRRPFQTGSRQVHSCSSDRRRHFAQRCQLPVSAVQQATAVAAPPGLATVPWDDTPEQQQALAAVQQRLAGSEHGQPDTETIQWFLRDRRFDVDDTVSKLEKMMQWRSGFRADQITEASVAAEAATGKAYLHSSTDVHGRPVIVIRVKKHITKEFPLEDSKRLCVYLLEAAMAQLPAGSETLLGIFDLRGFRNRNADLGFVRFLADFVGGRRLARDSVRFLFPKVIMVHVLRLVDIFFTYYPKRLGQVLFVDAPWMFQPGWEIVKPWLKKYAALVRFVDRKQLLEEYFTLDTVPEDFKH